jgi:hypothetical protein
MFFAGEVFQCSMRSAFLCGDSDSWFLPEHSGKLETLTKRNCE